MPEKFKDEPSPQERKKRLENPVVCLSCGKEEESPGYNKYGLPKKPKGWKQYYYHFFCPECTKEGKYLRFKHW